MKKRAIKDIRRIKREEIGDEYLDWWQIELKHNDVMEKFKKLSDNKRFFKVHIRRYVANLRYRSILDCGAGLCEEYYGYKRDGYKIDYHAVDATPIFVEEGRKKGIDISLQSLDSLSYGDNSFDVCVCIAVLNHLKDYKDSIREMVRVSRRETIITFFKPFSDGDDDVIETRCSDTKNRQTVLIYNFISEKRLNKFLDTLDINYRHEQLTHLGKTSYILYITKSG